MAILVYVDPSPRGAWALAAASGLSVHFRGSVTLLATEEDLRRDPELLDRARAALGPAAESSAVKTAPGPAEQAIAREAASGYQLLIVPPAGRGAIERMLKGSRIATVVRGVKAPVLVARRVPPRFTRVLGAVSGGALTPQVRDAALSIAGATSAELSFVHVVSEVAVPGASAGALTDPVSDVQKALAARSPAVALEVREGLVVDEVLEAFEHGAHDLLVIGSARGNLEWGQEDVTERLLLGCGGSVLVVPETGL